MTYEDKLINRIKQGDLHAAEELIEMFYPEILRYCLWHTPNRSSAEDATQETFLKVIRYFDCYTHKEKFKPFLYKIAANTCIDIYRKKERRDVSLEELPLEFAYHEPGFEQVQSDMTLRQLVKSLPAELQEIILLRFGQDLTMREIAQVVDAPLRTVQSRLRSALKKLKKDFEKEKGGSL